MSNYVERTAANNRSRFEDHVVTELLASPDTGTWVYQWSKPGTWVDGMRFVIHRGWLTVLGDLGEAVYQWSSRISPEFLSDLNFDYFRSKCQASEIGRKAEEFNADEGVAKLLREVKDAEAEERLSWAGTLKTMVGSLRGCSDKDEWVRSLDRDYLAGEIESFDDVQYLYDCPTVPSRRSITHWVGVTMAMKAVLEGRAK